jgi:hypothetical protein
MVTKKALPFLQAKRTIMTCGFMNKNRMRKTRLVGLAANICFAILAAAANANWL